MGNQKHTWTVSWKIGAKHGFESVEADTAVAASKAVQETVALREFGMNERKNSVVILSIGLAPTKIAA